MLKVTKNTLGSTYPFRIDGPISAFKQLYQYCQLINEEILQLDEIVDEFEFNHGREHYLQLTESEMKIVEEFLKCTN